VVAELAKHLSFPRGHPQAARRQRVVRDDVQGNGTAERPIACEIDGLVQAGAEESLYLIPPSENVS
jgi:hypothetical protein